MWKILDLNSIFITILLLSIISVHARGGSGGFGGGGRGFGGGSRGFGGGNRGIGGGRGYGGGRQGYGGYRGGNFGSYGRGRPVVNNYYGGGIRRGFYGGTGILPIPIFVGSYGGYPRYRLVYCEDSFSSYYGHGHYVYPPYGYGYGRCY